MSEGTQVVVALCAVGYLIGLVIRAASLNTGATHHGNVSLGGSFARAVWWPFDVLFKTLSALFDMIEGNGPR